MSELTQGRDFVVYEAGMEASLRVKVDELGPHIQPGLIVDGGCAAGSLISVLRQGHPESRFVGIDRSTTFVQKARNRFEGRHNVRIIEGNVQDMGTMVEAGTASTVVLASTLHEVHSYAGYDLTPVHATLRGANHILRSDGRLLIRDGIAPSRAVVGLRCSKKNGAEDGSVAELSTDALFRRFCNEYRNGIGVPFDREIMNGKSVYLLTARDAYEFLAKMNYRTNWAQEVNEQYGFWRAQEWKRALQDAGFQLVRFKEMTNSWILEHHYKDRALLVDPWSRRTMPWFPTHTLIVAKKV